MGYPFSPYKGSSSPSKKERKPSADKRGKVYRPKPSYITRFNHNVSSLLKDKYSSSKSDDSRGRRLEAIKQLKAVLRSRENFHIRRFSLFVETNTAFGFPHPRLKGIRVVPLKLVLSREAEDKLLSLPSSLIGEVNRLYRAVCLYQCNGAHVRSDPIASGRGQPPGIPVH